MQRMFIIFFLIAFVRLSGAVRPGWTIYFDKVHDGLKCDEPTLTRGRVEPGGIGFDKCRQRCIDNDACNFFAYWRKTRHCETYASCDNRVKDEKANDVVIWGRLSECEHEQGLAGPESSLITMANQFQPAGIVQYETNVPNMICQCTGLYYLLCGIFVEPGSPVDDAVQKKLTKTNLPNMEPFYVMTGPNINLEDAYICCDLRSAVTGAELFVELEVFPFSRCVDRAICAGSVQKPEDEARCPVMKTEFQSGEFVFVIKSDAEKVARGEQVPCISVNGLRALRSPMGITDPFGREPRGKGVGLVELRDYQKIMLMDEEMMESGICPKPATAAIQGASSGAGPSDLPMPGSAGSPRKPKKKKAKKKKKGKGSAADTEGAEEETEESPDLSPSKFEGLTVMSPQSDPGPQSPPGTSNLSPPSSPRPASTSPDLPLTANIPSAPMPGVANLPASAEPIEDFSPSGRTLTRPLTPAERLRRKQIRGKRIPKSFLPSPPLSDEELPKLDESVQAAKEPSTFTINNYFSFLLFTFFLFVFITFHHAKSTSSRDVYVEFSPEVETSHFNIF